MPVGRYQHSPDKVSRAVAVQFNYEDQIRGCSHFATVTATIKYHLAFSRSKDSDADVSSISEPEKV